MINVKLTQEEMDEVFLVLKGKVGGKYIKRVKLPSGKWKYYYSQAEIRKETQNKRNKTKKGILEKRQDASRHASERASDTKLAAQGYDTDVRYLEKKQKDKRRTKNGSLDAIKERKKLKKQEGTRTGKEAKRLESVAKFKSAKEEYAQARAGKGDKEKAKKRISKVMASQKKKYGKVMVKSAFGRQLQIMKSMLGLD